MAVYLMPAYLKPYIKVTSWTLNMCYLEEENAEYITDYSEVNAFFKDTVPVFNKYEKLVLRTDIRGHAMSYKVSIEPTSRGEVPVEVFVSKATRDKELGKAKVNANLLNSSGYKLIDEVYNLLDQDLRATIATPTQWLVYSSKERILTRLCWVINIAGEVIVRPYGGRSILLEVESLGMDKVNSVSLKVLKKHGLVREQLNDYWRRKVSRESLAAELEELSLEEAGEEESEAEEVGHVE